MRGRKTSLVVLLTAEERDQLEQWERSTRTPVGQVRRAVMILRVADGFPISHAAQAAGMREKHGRKWVHRFLEKRIDGLSDLPGRGRKPAFSPCGVALHGQDRV